MAVLRPQQPDVSPRSSRLRDVSNGDEIFISDRTNVASGHFDESLRAAESTYELDLESVGLVDLNDGTEITAAEPVLG
jgi:hypothetical protein